MTGPDPAVAEVRTAVLRAVADLPRGAWLLAACSGGADSLALAEATAFVAARRGLQAAAVVVDHGWHPDSASVAARAAAACRAFGLAPVSVVDVAGPVDASATGGPEAVARAQRYAAIESVARPLGATVLLGHTLDDQAETVLLGLARGSGARSLAGMPQVRGRLRRPLLGVSRTTTRRACERLGVAVWDDPANTDAAYARARLRAVVATLGDALGPGLVAGLARTADLLREDADALDAAASELVDQLTVARASDGLPLQPSSYPVGGLAAAPDAVRRRALLMLLRQAGCPAGALGRRHVLAVDAFVVAWHGQGPTHLPGGVLARRDYGRLVLEATPTEPTRE